MWVARADIDTAGPCISVQEWPLPAVCNTCLQALFSDSHLHWVPAEMLRSFLIRADVDTAGLSLCSGSDLRHHERAAAVGL